MDPLEDWYEEKRSAFLYRIMANKEPDLIRKKLFFDLAGMAEKQAAVWQQEIVNTSKKIPEFKPDVRTRLVARLVSYFGIKPLRLILPAMKVRGMSVYSETKPGSITPSTIAAREGRHKAISTGGNLRAAVFGINDGLLSNSSLLLGVSGANVDPHIIILTGVAGLLAGACSMAAGEYISVRSQRELYEYQIELERQELKLYPEEEAAELALIYQARGMDAQEAQNLANVALTNPEKALDTLAREELGLNPQELGSPWGAASSSFISFCIGAIIPLLPFLILHTRWSLLIMIILTAVALFGIGALLSLFTNRSAINSGFRMLFIGLLAGCFTYLIGTILGVTLH